MYSDYNSDETLQLAMPLVMMCGYPCSGKTTFVEKLQKHLEKMKKNVVIVSDDSVGIDRNSTYHRLEITLRVKGIIKFFHQFF